MGPNELALAGKVALVTGGGRGIGRAIALRLARAGADVAVNYFRNRDAADEAAEVVRALGRRAEVVKANVGDADGPDRLMDATLEAFGGLDLLVNNAASGYIRPIAEQRVKGWDWTMDINARAALFLAQRALEPMRARGGGAIVNISSLGSQRVMPDYVVIGASKAALEALTRYMAVEAGGHRRAQALPAPRRDARGSRVRHPGGTHGDGGGHRGGSGVPLQPGRLHGRGAGGGGGRGLLAAGVMRSELERRANLALLRWNSHASSSLHRSSRGEA
jgi:NADP-dependent 3-hydroxy acid dehydrogenase YdfG